MVISSEMILQFEAHATQVSVLWMNKTIQETIFLIHNFQLATRAGIALSRWSIRLTFLPVSVWLGRVRERLQAEGYRCSKNCLRMNKACGFWPYISKYHMMCRGRVIRTNFTYLIWSSLLLDKAQKETWMTVKSESACVSKIGTLNHAGWKEKELLFFPKTELVW